MEIVLKRIAKQNTYTIGRMYILKDEEVERKVNYTLNKDQKRSFCHVVDVGKLDGENYFCDTLEPTWRNLLGITLLPQEENVRLGRVSEKKAQKMKGKTAIPRALIPCSSPSRRDSSSGCPCCRAFLALRASASMPVTTPMIRRAASCRAKTNSEAWW